MANRFPSHYPDIGVLGEDLVAQWLQSTGWDILHRRWRCRWGEIDIIAQQESGVRREDAASPKYSSSLITHHPPLLAFVEVKTRSRGNWDAGGLLSVTPQKQAKLWRSAEYFLGTYPDLGNCTCRFDVALVYYQRQTSNQYKSATTPSTQLDAIYSLTSAGYQLLLQEYIPAAFA